MKIIRRIDGIERKDAECRNCRITNQSAIEEIQAALRRVNDALK